jgi:hypothetical protein
MGGAWLVAHRADERRRRCGQLLGEGRRSEGGGPVARGGGEGGDCGCGIRAEKTNGVGVKNPTDGGDNTLLKGAAGTQRRGGGSGEVGRCVEGLEEGGPSSLLRG